MNTTQKSEQDTMNRIFKSIGLSAANEELAKQYLLAEQADSSLLEQAEAQDFSQNMSYENRFAQRYLAELREKGKQEEWEQWIKLYWAIGKSTAVDLLEDGENGILNEKEIAKYIHCLGEAEVVALMAEYFAGVKMDLEMKAYGWLLYMAQNQPQTVELAQTMGGASNGNMRVLLSGILLYHQGKGDTASPEAAALIDRQITILLEESFASWDNLFHSAIPMQDREELKKYIQNGNPQLPVPLGTTPRFRAYDAASAMNAYENNSYLVSLLGRAAFWAQEQDERARCAVRVYATLSPMYLLNAILITTPTEYLVKHINTLVSDIPGKETTFLLRVAGMNIGEEKASVFKRLAQRYKSGIELAKQLANDSLYASLEQLLPQFFDKEDTDFLKHRIIQEMKNKLSAGKNCLENYLCGEGSLKDSDTQLSSVKVDSSYWTIYPIEYRLKKYYQKKGLDDFICRFITAVGILFERVYGISAFLCKEGTREFENNSFERLIKTVLEKELPMMYVLKIYEIIFEDSYSDTAFLNEKMNEIIAQPEYMEELCKTFKEGNIFARCTVLSTLEQLYQKNSDNQAVKKEIFAAAGDSSKQIQEKVQAIFDNHPEWEADYAELLKSKKAGLRMMAVQALSKLGDKYHPALREALEQEKSAKVVDAIQAVLGCDDTAMEMQDTEELINRILKGGKSRKIQWLLGTPLPKLHLKDENHTLVSENQRNALLVSYCDLGRIGRSETAAKIAENMDEGDLTAFALEVYDRWIEAGAQSKTKWVLPFAAVFGGQAITQKLKQAISEWPQVSRGAIACDAVNALALSSDPAGLLIVDSIARKFKFRQVKAAAGAALDNAAKELGITIEELADRIVPDLGFSVDGKRVFDYGTRQFTVCLTPTLEISVLNDAGKTVKNMPAPGKTDDAEKAQQAYQEFKDMKKQIRTTVSAQKARLEAALSGLRCWDTDNWKGLFVQNPIMHQFAISLIWGVYKDGKLQETFRYMEDGSFNTVEEEEYILPEGAKIGLVHPVELDTEALNAWKQQLKDYEITQSILQLERPVYYLEEDKREERSLDLFGGKMLNDLSLIGKMQGLGWYKGSVQDGGAFFTFYREDAALGLGVELEFSGCYVGGENDTVTVYEAIFYRAGTVERGSYCYDEPKKENIFSLGEVPPRYYSEIVYQLEQATASSTETESDWKMNTMRNYLK